jgi:IMP dehydrogenase
MQSQIPFSLSYDDVLLVPSKSSISSRSEVDLSVQLTPHVNLDIPILSANMDTVTGISMAISLGMMGGLAILPRFNEPLAQAQMVQAVKIKKVLVGAAIGVRDGYLDRVKLLVEAGTDMLVLDVAHGHQEQVIGIIHHLKKEYPNIDLMAGNVATYQAAKDLFAAGADSVKVGIGPGSACTTRIQTGFGVPQISAIMDAAKAAQEQGKSLICDGGIKNSGDIVKGLAAGSHSVMIGSLLAGTDEAPGDIMLHDGRQYKRYNGSASLEEKKRQVKNISENFTSTYLEHVEGVSALVPYQGSLEQVVRRLLAGIRSGYSYGGARNIEELHKMAKFIQVSSLGMRESAPHDLIISG